MKQVSSFLFLLIILIFCVEQNSFAQNLNIDSMRAARKIEIDSMKAVQQHRADSMKEIRLYRQSDRFKDSVANVRQQRVDSMRSSQQQKLDSVKVERKRVSDSLLNERRLQNETLKRQLDSTRSAQKAIIEEQRAERQRRTDSMSAIREYRQSEPYKDSVATERQQRLDSISTVRKQHNDSVRAIQVARTDSMKVERQKANDEMKASLDSMRTVRQQTLDSMATVREIRKDSIAQVKAERDAKKKLREEEKEEKRKLAFEFKIQKKKDAYTNEDMRKKKWSLPRRFLQNTYTRYNYYFNTNEKMKEAIQNMIRSHEDDFDSMIALFPFDPDIDSAKLSSDMDSIIQKASVGIQIHDPRAKWQDDLYLLVGQAYYYKADYENAGSAFKHIVVQAEEDKKEREKNKKIKTPKDKPVSFSEEEKTGLAGFLEHTSGKNEAMLWLSRTLTKSKKEGQAQTLLDMLYNDANFPERLYGRLALEQAFIDIYREDYSNAIKSLMKVSEDNEIPKWLRLRSNYLLAQLFQNEGNYAQSNEYFEKTVALHPELEMNFYARKNIAFNNLAANNHSEEAAESLKKMAEDGKFKPFLDQIYYALAKTEEQNNNSEQLIGYLQQSIKSSQNNNKQKGLSFALLGDAYYKTLSYSEAKKAYDSAAMFLTPEQDPTYSLAIQRSQSLNEIVNPAELVRHQDSVLHLASLSEKEQRSIIKAYIKALEKQINDSIFLSENQQNIPSSMPPQGMNMNAQSWYFSNPNLMQKGLNDFKQKWGNRKLADNWRRSTGSAFDDNSNEFDDLEGDDLASNLPNEDSLFAAIPRSPEEIQKEKKNLEQALFLLGKAYYTHLDDYDNANKNFDRLDSEFPNHENKAEVLYNRYLMAMRQNNSGPAQGFQNELQNKYPESEWAVLLKDVSRGEFSEKESISSPEEKRMKIAEFYDQTYQLLDLGEHAQVLSRIKDADELYPNKGDFEKKFSLMKAIALVGVKEYENAEVIIDNFLQQYPEDTLTPWAVSVKDFITNNRTEKDSRLNDVNEISQNPESENEITDYIFNAQESHYVILLAPADNRIFALRAGLLDYNIMKPGLSETTVTMSTFMPGKNMIVCKEFPNSNAAKSYLNGIRSNKNLFSEYPQKDYDAYLISEENFLKFKQDQNIEEYDVFYKKNYK